MLNNIWKRLSSSQKLSLLGSLFLIISLFLNWFSDKDVFRSGDNYTALSGPLSFVGLSILLLAAFNLALVIMTAMRVKMVIKQGAGARGKMQMALGFGSMYLLMVINSVYFHPQFGLNILEKKSEIGVLVALAATVMICVAGYLTYRQKFAQMAANNVVNESVQANLSTNSQPAQIVPESAEPRMAPGMAPAQAQVAEPAYSAPAAQPAYSAPAQPALAGAVSNKQDPYFSERDPRGKTEYERTKLYENLKKTMIRDTMSPEQRRKLLAKEANANAFSANFGKSGPVRVKTDSANADRKARSIEETLKSAAAKSAPAAAQPAGTEKKPQMYRMDL